MSVASFQTFIDSRKLGAKTVKAVHLPGAMFLATESAMRVSFQWHAAQIPGFSISILISVVKPHGGSGWRWLRAAQPYSSGFYRRCFPLL